MRVHSKDGLKPVEEIKAGDYVLSCPEDGAGNRAVKMVTDVCMLKEKTIRKISTYGPNSETQYFVAATGEHLFWVESVGWTRADQLKRGNILRKVDGGFTEIANQHPVYRTGQDGVGWVQALTDVEGSYGTLFDYENYDAVPRQGKAIYLSPEVYASDTPYLHVSVYDLKVEDYRTYYIGIDGILVRSE